VSRPNLFGRDAGHEMQHVSSTKVKTAKIVRDAGHEMQHVSRRKINAVVLEG
jgi:hypothetical protein